MGACAARAALARGAVLEDGEGHDPTVEDDRQGLQPHRDRRVRERDGEPDEPCSRFQFGPRTRCAPLVEVASIRTNTSVATRPSTIPVWRTGARGRREVEVLPDAGGRVDDEPDARAHAEGFAQPRNCPRPPVLREPPEAQKVRREDRQHQQDRADVSARVRHPDEAREREGRQQPRQREVRRQDRARELSGVLRGGLPRRVTVRCLPHAGSPLRSTAWGRFALISRSPPGGRPQSSPACRPRSPRRSRSPWSSAPGRPASRSVS